MVNTIREFVSLLNPCNGAVFLGTEKEGSGYRQHKYADADAAIADAEKFAAVEGMSVWFSLASFKDTSSRKRENAKSMKAFFVDVDCGEGKPFATQKEGARAVLEFAKKLKLPAPMLVDSGKGIHAYWVLSTPVTTDQWRKLANVLKAQFPLVAGTTEPAFDPVPTADVARVTRLLASDNPKTGRKVRILHRADPVAYEFMSQCLAPFTKVPATATSGAKLLANLTSIYSDSPPANPDLVYSKCQQVAWCVDNPNSVTEPLWYAMLGIAAYCDDPDKTAIEWSKGHPAFDAQATIAKMMQWKSNTDGPAKCSKFEELNPTGCNGCPFKDKISTPLRVGVRSQEVPPPAEAEHENARTVPLPKGFSRTERGIVIIQDEIELEVCPFEIYPVDYGRKDGVDHELAWFRWFRKNVGWCELELRIAHLVGLGDKTLNREFMAAIADQGIIMDSPLQAMRFQVLLRNYIKQLQEQQTITNQYSSFGWKDNRDFLLGDILIRSTGEKKNLAPSDVMLTKRRLPQDMFCTNGSLQRWKAYQEVFTSCGLEHVKFALLLGFAAPLAQPAKVKGTTIHLYGPSGAGKTLAQKIQLSIYGDPERAIQSSFTTTNAFIDTLASRNSLPVCLDESTVWNPKTVGEVLYWVEQGTNKSRLNRTGSQNEPKHWHTLVTTSGNRSIASDIEAAGFQSDAQMARLIELNIPANSHLTKRSDIGRALFNTYTDNYGEAGEVYITELVKQGYDVLYAQFEEARVALRKDLGIDFSGVERYYEDVFSLAYLGGKIADSLGLVHFDVRNTLKWAYNNLDAMRKSMESNRREPLDYVLDYMNEFAKNRIDILYTAASNHTVSSPEYMPTGGIIARLEMHRDKVVDKPHTGVVYLQRSKFKRWLATQGMDYRTIEAHLKERGLEVVVPGDRLLLGKHTPLKVAQERVVGISMECPELRGLLTDADSALTEKQLRKLQVIEGGKK